MFTFKGIIPLIKHSINQKKVNHELNFKNSPKCHSSCYFSKNTTWGRCGLLYHGHYCGHCSEFVEFYCKTHPGHPNLTRNHTYLRAVPAHNQRYNYPFGRLLC